MEQSPEFGDRDEDTRKPNWAKPKEKGSDSNEIA